MATRCASCSYPLSVSDSVSCFECSSYFHIDCAQLVGFPYYELSSDPARNKFHCQTCKILPLPRPSESYIDSDSDSECAMPSRQLDYSLQGQPDLAQDMNEIKGTVQDLSELCKDMFREINELKSINLTLRCGVENLRHENEKRDNLIGELRRRIEALEDLRFVGRYKHSDSTDVCLDGIPIERDDEVERYSTPDPEYARLRDLENLEQEDVQNDQFRALREVQTINQNLYMRHTPVEEEGKDKETVKESSTTKYDPLETTTERLDEGQIDCIGTNNEDKSYSSFEARVSYAEEESIAKPLDEDTEVDTSTSVKDWDWKGNKAIQLNKDDESESTVEEEDKNEGSDVEETEEAGWEILAEKVKSQFVNSHYDEESTGDFINSEDSQEDINEKSEERKVKWADEVDKYESEEEESNISLEQTNVNDSTEIFQTEILPRSDLQEQGTEEKKEEVADGAERTSLNDEEGAEKSKLEGDAEVVEGGAEVEGRIESEEGTRLEGEPRLESDPGAEGGPAAEGELREGGQSPEVQVEVQPSELSESSEPPPPPLPQHTPDDLWDYLKETVTGEHPATVEEFVQKLIGTLEHVPEEYLKPVIEYNIQRATSPSVTDGEHLDAKEGEHKEEGEAHGQDLTDSGETAAHQEGQAALEEEEHNTSHEEGETLATESSGAPSDESAALQAEVTSDIPEEPAVADEMSESAEGYPALEGALFGGFWVVWALYSFWDT